MNLNQSEKSAVSRLFSSSVIREMANKGRSGLFSRLAKQTGLFDAALSCDRVRDAYERAFDVLRRGQNRDEYIYRAALTHRVLLGKHSLTTACMLSEFRVRDCKADVVILNGTGTVYEIKSERDSLSRLERQLEAYSKVFARVFVIAGENHVDAVAKVTPNDIGVLKLSNRQSISTLREAEVRPDRVCPLSVLDAVRTNEALHILAELGIEAPQVPNTIIRQELRKCFEILRPDQVHFAMVKTLKSTRNLMPLAGLVESLPLSLQAAALSVPLKKREHHTLLKAIDTRLEDAMNWA